MWFQLLNLLHSVWPKLLSWPIFHLWNKNRQTHGNNLHRFSKRSLQSGTHIHCHISGHLPIMFSAFIQHRIGFLQFSCEALHIVDLAGTMHPPNFFPIFRLSPGWAGNQRYSHKKHKFLQYIRHDAATLWQWRKRRKLRLPKITIYRKLGEWRTVGFGIKCPGSYISWKAIRATFHDLFQFRSTYSNPVLPVAYYVTTHLYWQRPCIIRNDEF